MPAQHYINKMITRKLGITLLICIIQGVLFFAALETTAVKVSNARLAMKVPALNANAQISAKRAATKLDPTTRRATAPIAPKDLDGRSAYINNQYIDDAEPPPTPYNDTSPPLYQFLQEQMEHILATSLPGEYQLQDNHANNDNLADDVDAGKETLLNAGYGGPVLQSNSKSPGELAEVAVEEPYQKKKEQAETFFHGSMPTRPVLELPKPISVANKPPTTGYNNQLNISRPHQVPSVTKQDEPQILTDSGYSLQLQNQKLHTKPQKSSPPSKFTFEHENSTLTMRKRRITFKTIATSSQIISTPLADLLFKYSIGMAKPSLGAAGNSLENMQGSERISITVPKICNDQLNPSSYTRPSLLYGQRD